MSQLMMRIRPALISLPAAFMCLGVSLSALAAPSAKSPEKILQKIQKTYKSAGNIQADFTQTFVEKLRGRKRAESGVLWATEDGRVRWEYRNPTKKYFVYNGTTAWFYEPENAQVTEFEKFEDSQLSRALEFLLGRGSLLDTFTASACEKDCDKLATVDDRRHAAIALRPIESIAGVERLIFVIDTSRWRVLKTVVFDPIGNRTEYAFSAVQWGTTISDRVFEFEVPAGVNRLRAAAPTEAKKAN